MNLDSNSDAFRIDGVWQVLAAGDVTSRFPDPTSFRVWLEDPTRRCTYHAVSGNPVSVVVAHHLTGTEHAALAARWADVCPHGFPAEPGDGYVTAAATLPGHRHHGHFSVLLRDTLAWFHGREPRSVITTCWQHPGDTSLHAFTDAGFEPVADLADYWEGYHDTATLMRHSSAGTEPGRPPPPPIRSNR